MAKRRICFFAVLGLFAAGILAVTVVRAEQYSQVIGAYIEVCDKGIAYVPLGTKYVKCHGIIRKVVGETDSLADCEVDCQCPHCCDGACYVIIASEPAPESGSAGIENRGSETGKEGEAPGRRDIKFLWIEC